MKIIRVVCVSIIALIGCVLMFPVAVIVCLAVVIGFICETFDDVVNEVTGRRLGEWWNLNGGDA